MADVRFSVVRSIRVTRISLAFLLGGAGVHRRKAEVGETEVCCLCLRAAWLQQSDDRGGDSKGHVPSKRRSYELGVRHLAGSHRVMFHAAIGRLTPD